MAVQRLATELVCYLRYKRHYYMATGLKSSVAADEFLEHANEEQEHADRLAERIVQLAKVNCGRWCRRGLLCSIGR